MRARGKESGRTEGNLGEAGTVVSLGFEDTREGKLQEEMRGLINVARDTGKEGSLGKEDQTGRNSAVRGIFESWSKYKGRP